MKLQFHKPNHKEKSTIRKRQLRKNRKTSEAVKQEFQNYLFMVSKAISGFYRLAKCKRGVGISPPSDFDIRSIAEIYAC